MITLFHLLWIPAGALVSFATSWVFGDLLLLQPELCNVIYCEILIWFFIIYTEQTKLSIFVWIPKRITQLIIPASAAWFLITTIILFQSTASGLTGVTMVWGIFQNTAQIIINGILLLIFPVIVILRTYAASKKQVSFRPNPAAVAWACMFMGAIGCLGGHKVYTCTSPSLVFRIVFSDNTPATSEGAQCSAKK
ncbi:MAG: hypothetical protein GF401_16290 [Chitinivibrionales bacterium]|nr:hypothetical protein [Chitinivibrionales bacterium]